MIKIWCSAIFKQQRNVIVRSSLEIRVSVGERKILTTYLFSFWKRERLTKLNSEYICSTSLNGNNDWLRAIHQYIYITEPNKIFFSNKRNKYKSRELIHMKNNSKKIEMHEDYKRWHWLPVYVICYGTSWIFF